MCHVVPKWVIGLPFLVARHSVPIVANRKTKPKPDNSEPTQPPPFLAPQPEFVQRPLAKPPEGYLFGPDTPLMWRKPQLQQLCCEKVLQGSKVVDALLTHGISKQQWNDWRVYARKNIEPYATFVLALREAESFAKEKVLHAFMLQALTGDYRAQVAWLEKRYPKEYGSRAEHKVKAEVTAPCGVLVIEQPGLNDDVSFDEPTNEPTN